MTRCLSAVLLAVFVLCAVVTRCLCWDQTELDLFDLVEDIGENFYDIMQLDQVYNYYILCSF